MSGQNSEEPATTELKELSTDHWASHNNNVTSYGINDENVVVNAVEADDTANPAVGALASGGENLKRSTLSWKGINVFAPINRGSICKRLCCKGGEENEPSIKQILFDANGTVEPGTLLAVMGASGAGKTTLMNVLAHRNIGSVQVMGTVMVNNTPVGININSISAYIQQEDLFIGTLTVREHLTFQALLRMEKHVSKEERLDKVEKALHELGLMKCANTMIGIPGRMRGISGGEKKRLSFASEVLTDPAILFADEPTSGLDSFMAQNVVSTLQKLASQGRTIVCTIHQPSSEVYAMFSSVMYMAEGRVAFLGSSSDALPYFDSVGYSCPPNFNPADYFVQLLAIVPGQEDKSRTRAKSICDAFAEKTEKEDDGTQSSFSEDEVFTHRPYKASWCTQFRAVLRRSWISSLRDKMMLRLRLIQSVFFGVIAGLIYLQIPIDTSGVQNISGAMFFLVMSVSFFSFQAVIFVFPSELPVFLRDHKNGMYRTDVYFLSKTFAEFPIFILFPLILISIAYWMIGLRPEFLPFVYAFCILTLITNVPLSFGYIISALVPTVEGAASIGPPLMIPLMLFGGFFLKDSTVPDYFLWIKYISWFRYGFELMIVNQWDGYGTISNCTAGAQALCIPDGQAAIEFLGLDKDNFMIDIYALLALFVGFRIIAFLLLLRRSSKTQ